ncbi:hypothetical protein PoB_001154700 [Plakobranchus ocellatus]|uniref:Uncharacterized protein n=1 Tax=Plakobranchus ocellatus TaxID=259542 RepID=A0AAV3YSE0_9GAST|nr:hypothetical protein PoB_001154700 [Plakobranchus ocellatus]
MSSLKPTICKSYIVCSAIHYVVISGFLSLHRACADDWLDLAISPRQISVRAPRRLTKPANQKCSLSIPIQTANGPDIRMSNATLAPAVTFHTHVFEIIPTSIMATTTNTKLVENTIEYKK